MSLDLTALAQRIAGELARADYVTPNGHGGTAVATRVATGPVSSPSPSPRAVDAPLGVEFVRANARIGDFIDHTLLKAEATARDVETLCAEAAEHKFAAVCVNPVWVKFCADRLRGTDVKVASVIAFPLGATRSDVKAFEAQRAVDDDADELDMVAAIGQIKGGDWHYVADDIATVVRAGQGRLVKVIIESAVLTPVEIIKTSALAREAGAHYVKTSTGFHAAGGASAEAVALMRLIVGDAMGVKASGGVRDCSAALKMIAAGATRIGTSGGVAMAKCLGPGPLPLGELLASPLAHGEKCVSCSLPAPAAAVQGSQVY
jgi:deoxyribose-phosphate aldolase